MHVQLASEKRKFTMLNNRWVKKNTNFIMAATGPQAEAFKVRGFCDRARPD